MKAKALFAVFFLLIVIGGDISMAYERVNWQNGPSAATKVSAENLNIMDAGIAEAHALVATKAEQSDLNEGLNLKRDKATLISTTDIDKTSDATKIHLNDLAAEVQAAMAGTAPVISSVANNSLTYEKYATNSIDESKIDFMKVLSDNLVDKSKMVTGGYYTGSGAWAANTTYQSSGLIEVEAGQAYIKTNSFTATYWSESFAFVSSFTAASFTVPAGVKYVRCTYLSSDLAPQLNKGTSLQAYDEYRVGSDKLRLMNVSASDISDLSDTTTENLFDKSTVTKGYKLDASGNPLVDATYSYSDFIPVDDWGIYIQTNIHTVNYYDVNQEWIMSGTTTQPFTVPADQGIKYAKINVPIAQLETAMLVMDSALPSVYIPYNKKDLDKTKFFLKGYTKSKLYGKKWNAYGDSITRRGFGYHAIIKTNVGGMTVRNYGLSGRSIASRGTATDTTYPPAVTDYVNMDNDADIISIFLGTNDFGSQVPLGTISSTTTTEFYGALNVLALGLIEKYPGKDICFITPIQRNVTGDDAKAIPLTSYVDAIKEVGAKYGIPVYDLYANCGLYPKSSIINTNYFEGGDGIHPNLNGHKVIAPRIQAFLEDL